MPLSFVMREEVWPPSVVLWPDEVEGPWEVTLVWAPAEDRVECAGVSLRSTDVDRTGPVTATLLRSLPVVRLVREARARGFAEAGGSDAEGIAAAGHEQLAEQLEAQAEAWLPRRPGRPVVYDDAHYARIAEIYSSARRRGEHPLVAVSEQEHVARSTAARWVATAREAGHLPPTTPGRAKGREVGPKET